MIIRDVAAWGFLLEHNGLPFFVPVSRLPISFASKIQIKEGLVVVVKPTDHPFFFDDQDQAHMLTETSMYVPMIKEAMVNWARMQQRR